MKQWTWTVVALAIAGSVRAQPEKSLDAPAADPANHVTLPERAPAMYEAVKGAERVQRSPWLRYFTTDRWGRLITFYVTENALAPKTDSLGQSGGGVEAERLPVIVYVQGSGSQSIFTEVQGADGPRVGASGGQGQVSQAAGGKAIVVIAEKPGVGFLDEADRPGGAVEAGAEFRAEHTLDRWSEAVAAAMKAALTLPRADPARVMMEGHSEGGLVACKVAADHPEVTHVATLAGGGPTQLFDLLELARSGTLCGGQLEPAECEKMIRSQWDEVLKDPDATDKYFMGHPHRRWMTFLASSPAEELTKTGARVFIGQGTADQAVAPVGADMLYATLLALGRDVTYSKVEGGDHGFMTATADGGRDPAGWGEMHARVVGWFLGSDGAEPTGTR